MRQTIRLGSRRIRKEAPPGNAKAARTAEGHHAHSFADLIADLGTLCRNEVCFGATESTFTRLTEPTDLQARAFELLEIKLSA